MHFLESVWPNNQFMSALFGGRVFVHIATATATSVGLIPTSFRASFPVQHPPQQQQQQQQATTGVLTSLQELFSLVRHISDSLARQGQQLRVNQQQDATTATTCTAVDVLPSLRRE